MLIFVHDSTPEMYNNASVWILSHYLWNLRIKVKDCCLLGYDAMSYSNLTRQCLF